MRKFLLFTLVITLASLATAKDKTVLTQTLVITNAAGDGHWEKVK